MTAAKRLWAAVTHRLRAADGLFVYAVRSTGIFCRPSCPSRRPKPEHVEFFPSAAAAIAAGYRACRRCHPDTARGDDARSQPLRRVCEAVHRSPDKSWTSGQLAAAAGISVSRLQRAFRATLGLAPRDYVAACRRRTFLARLRAGTAVTDAVYAAGYGSPSRVYGALRGFGMTPATYGAGGVGLRIDWLIGSSPIGLILIAASPRGVCFVEVGASRAILRAALRAEFPRAEVATRPSTRLRACLAAARMVAEAQATVPDVPIDIRGTAFQWRVWRALRHIPRGRTLTYTELAARIGQPTAVRAVARACATNPLALLVPCHRVIGSDGSLRGYRWGLGVKQTLLQREARPS